MQRNKFVSVFSNVLKILLSIFIRYSFSTKITCDKSRHDHGDDIYALILSMQQRDSMI